MFKHDGLIAWLETEMKKASDLVEVIENGKASFGSREFGGPWVDTTESTLQENKKKLSDMEPQLTRLLAEKKEAES